MAAITTPTTPKAWSPDISCFPATEAVPTALILETSSVCGSIEGDDPAVRVAFIDDADANFVAEGADIPEADADLSEVIVYTGKVAILHRISREQMRQQNVEEKLADSVARAVIKRANKAYLAQPAPQDGHTPPAGLLNIPGIVNGGEVKANLDGLVDLIATIEQNGGVPSHILMSPTAWASLRKLKTQTGAASSLLGAGSTDAKKMLLDLPVIVDPAVTTGAGMILDRNAIASAVGDVQVAQSEHFYFGSDSIALRCTWRFGANLVHPNRVGKFTVAA